jgi:hypothetical protein
MSKQQVSVPKTLDDSVPAVPAVKPAEEHLLVPEISVHFPPSLVLHGMKRPEERWLRGIGSEVIAEAGEEKFNEIEVRLVSLRLRVLNPLL